MFSTHLPRVHSVPREYLFMGAGVVLVISLLIAIASVASGEVKKAAMRDTTLASQRSAAAYCVETQRGAALNSCFKQAWQDASGESVQVAGAESAPFRTVVAAENSGFAPSAAVANVSTQGFVQASFGKLR